MSKIGVCPASVRLSGRFFKASDWLSYLLLAVVLAPGRQYWGHWGDPARREKKWKAKLSYATLSTTIKLNWIELDLIKGNQIILNKIKLNILWRKTTFDGRRPSCIMNHALCIMHDAWCMRTTSKQRGLAHCWKAHSAGHVPLFGIFFIARG